LNPGPSGVYSFGGDRRFGYCLHVPAVSGRPRGLLVTVHGSERSFMANRDGFIPFAERHGHVVLAPLFPIDVLGNGNGDGYKALIEVPLRYDRLLDAMVDEVARKTRCPRRFLLQGYSGGAQFAHRYAFVHPRRVRALAVGAPGQITLPDPARVWPRGLGGIEALFGVRLDLRALQRLPVQLVVGSQDTGRTPMVGRRRAGAHDEDDAEAATAETRIERARLLAHACREAGLRCTLQLLRGKRHGEGPLPAIAAAARFFARCGA
jgi:poly(3-hydroxybutyrate) depolymerase